MAIVVEHVSSSIGDTDRTISMTVETGEVLVAVIGIHQGSVNDVTWNGTSMTQGPNAATAFDERAEIWYDLTPEVGTHNLVFDGTTGGGRFLCGYVLSGVKTTGQPHKTATATGSSSKSSVTVTPTTDNCLIIDGHYSEGDFTTVGDRQTERANLQGNDSYENGASSTIMLPINKAEEMTWTISSGQRWASAVIALEPAADSPSGYSYYSQLTVDNTKVSGSVNITNHTLYISDTLDGTGSEPDLRTTGNGGQIQNTNFGGATDGLTVPADLAFYDDADATTQYDHEIISYNASTGAIKARVRIPTLTYNSDTDVYMHYGDSGVTVSQENISGVWTDYAASWNLNESSGIRYDGTGTNNLTATGVGTRTGNLFASAVDFGANTGHHLRADDNDSFDTTDQLTIIFWFYCDSTTGNRFVCAKGADSDATNTNYTLRLNTNSNYYDMFYYNSGSAHQALSSNSSMVEGQWNFFGLAFDVDASPTMIMNDNGTDDFSTWNQGDGTAAMEVNTDKFNIGVQRIDGSANQAFDGAMEAFRVRTSQMTDAELITIHNNESSPSTFYSVGNETEAGGGPAAIAASRRSIVY